MKKIKILKGKGKIIAALAVVISFATVLAWHQMQNASAHSQEKPGVSRTYTNGYGRFYVDGPGNKSSWLEVKFYCSGLGKNVTQSEFNDITRHITFSENKGGGGDYDLHLASWSADTYKNNNGRYTSLDVKIRYTIPAHEYESGQSQDSSNDYYVKATEGSTGHQDSDHTVYQTLRISAYSIGLSTHTDDNVRDFNCSRTFHMAHTKGTLKFDGNGGTLSFYSKDLWDRDQYGTFPTGWRTGYQLAGFYTNSAGYNGDWATEYWQFCSNYTIYAMWTPKTYDVSYDGNGEDSGNVDGATATYNSNFTLAQNGYKKKGYKFLGWSTNENATSPQYTPGQTFTYKTDGETTFYAVWEKDNFEVKFHGNGSSAADYTADLAYNKSVNLPKNIFERPGYTFVGWVEDPKQDTVKPDYTDGQAVKDLCNPGETFDLFALWKKSDGSFETQNIIHDDKMFLGDINLTGQNGTGYSNANIDSKSAHIDTEDDPGYFTDRYASNND